MSESLSPDFIEDLRDRGDRERQLRKDKEMEELWAKSQIAKTEAIDETLNDSLEIQELRKKLEDTEKTLQETLESLLFRRLLFRYQRKMLVQITNERDRLEFQVKELSRLFVEYQKANPATAEQP